MTFDDGPDPVWTPLVLDALADAGVRATFFVVAPSAGANPALLRRIVDEGHEVGLHCARHVRHDRMTRAGISADTVEGLLVLYTLGHRPRDWRTPWGVVTAGTIEVARRMGLRLVGWTADSEDWRGDAPGTMIPRLETRIEDGAVVLMHDGIGPGASRTGCAGTVALVEPLVATLRSRGLEAVPVGGLDRPVPDRNPHRVSRV